MSNDTDITQQKIESLITSVRGQQVMIDRDLAMLYGVETKQLNRQVKRNIERFPDDFMFQLTQEEFNDLRCQFGTSSWGMTRTLPYAFTENGVAMLSGVLRSQTAISVNINIMRAFTSMRHFLASHTQLFKRIETIEYNQLKTDKRLDDVLKRLDDKQAQPSQGIFYDGQMFDAYAFTSSLIKKACSSIILIDNYIDETVLTQLNKRSKGVSVTIYTSQVTKQLKLDIERNNSQYEPIEVKGFSKSHDRFLCIDDEVYHIGASLKDLGKRWFAFSKMEYLTPNELLGKMN